MEENISGRTTEDLKNSIMLQSHLWEQENKFLDLVSMKCTSLMVKFICSSDEFIEHLSGNSRLFKG